MIKIISKSAKRTITKPEQDRASQIVRSILNHPGISRASVAKETEIPVPTVQRRLADLEDAGEVINQYVLAPQNSFFPVRTLVGIKLRTAGLESKRYNYLDQNQMVCFIKWGLVQQPEFSDIMANVVLERVEQCFGGPYEIILLVSALNQNILATFVTGVIQKLEGVMETTTSMIVSYSKSVWKPKVKSKLKESAD